MDVRDRIQLLFHLAADQNIYLLLHIAHQKLRMAQMVPLRYDDWLSPNKFSSSNRAVRTVSAYLCLLGQASWNLLGRFDIQQYHLGRRRLVMTSPLSCTD